MGTLLAWGSCGKVSSANHVFPLPANKPAIGRRPTPKKTHQNAAFLRPEFSTKMSHKRSVLRSNSADSNDATTIADGRRLIKPPDGTLFLPSTTGAVQEFRSSNVSANFSTIIRHRGGLQLRNDALTVDENKQGLHDNGDQAARRPHISCPIHSRSFRDVAIALRLFVTTCKMLIILLHASCHSSLNESEA